MVDFRIIEKERKRMYDSSPKARELHTRAHNDPKAVKLKKYPDRDTRRITRSDLGGTFRARGETSMVIMDNTMGTHNTAVALL